MEVNGVRLEVAFFIELITAYKMNRENVVAILAVKLLLPPFGIVTQIHRL